jgi:uncharacterized protein
MSQIIYALSESSAQVNMAIRMFEVSTAATRFVHESYNRNNPAIFRWAWFAWPNLVRRTYWHNSAIVALLE